MTDPEAARIIDALIVRLAFPEHTQPNAEAYMEGIEYLMRVRREYPEHKFSQQLWALMAQYGIVT